MSEQTPWQDPRYRRPAPPQPPPYVHGRHPVPPPVYGPPVTAVPYAVRRRRVHPMAVVGLVLGGAALLCCGVGAVGALVDGGEPKGLVAEATVDPADTTDAAEPDLSTGPPAPEVTTAAPTSAAPPPSAKPKATTKPPATTRPKAPRTTAPRPAKTTTKPAGNCDPSYPTVCIRPGPPDLDCGDIPYRKFKVLPPDPHRLDGSDNDGIGCEST